MVEPLETAELLAFVRAAETKSLSRAAIELQTPRATLGRRLARLEERLGVRLLRRTTRRVVLTDAGEALYPRARIAIDAVEHAEESLRRTRRAVRGDLRISVPGTMPASFDRFIIQFGQRHPDVRLQVHFASEIVDLQRGSYDVALRASATLQSGLIARTLFREQVVAAASPAYLERAGTPRTRRDLKNHRCLMGFAGTDRPQTTWPLLGGGKLHVTGAFFANTPLLLREAAHQGAGIAMLPTMIGAPLFEDGDLVHVLPSVLGSDVTFSVVYPEREFLPPQVRAFVDAVVAWAPSTFPSACKSMTKRR